MNSTRIIQIVILVFLTASCSLNKHHRRFLVESETMLPTIAPGDYVVIDTNVKTFTYGDIVAYQYEGGYDGDFKIEPFSDIFRIIALPEDSIAVQNDICIINGIKNKYKYIKSVDFDDEYEEVLPNGMKITIYYYPLKLDDGRLTDFQITRVSKNRYFLMGDRRTGPLDSRFFGAVTKDKIMGKVIKIIKKNE